MARREWRAELYVGRKDVASLVEMDQSNFAR